MTFNWPRTVFLLLVLVSVGLSVPLFVGGREAMAQLLALPRWVGVALALVMLVIWSLNIIRLRLLFGRQLAGAGFWQLMRIYMATEFVSKTTPMGLGAPATAVSLLAPYGISPSQSLVVFGVSAFMDAVVVVALMGYFAIAELTISLNASLTSGVLLYTILMLLMIAGTVLLLYRHKLVYVVFLSVPGFSLTGRRGKEGARKIVVSLHRALKKVARLPAPVLLMSWGACLLYWGLYLSTLYLCIRVLGGNVSWVESGFIQVVAMGMGHLFMVPGGAGGADISGILLLEPALGAALAASTVILWRFLMLYLYLVVGGLSLLSLLRPGRE